MVVFLHTSRVHISTFEQLTKKIAPQITTQHYVNEDLLSYTQKNGTTDEYTFNQLILKAQLLQPKLIICTCSTYGPNCDQYNNVYRIDQPIATHLVNNYSRIGLAFTAQTTLQASTQLITTTAQAFNKEIEIETYDCSKSWKYFLQNEPIDYARSIAETIKKQNSASEVLFLAQASMVPSLAYLDNFYLPIFTSTEFGLTQLLSKLSIS